MELGISFDASLNLSFEEQVRKVVLVGGTQRDVPRDV